MASSAAPLESAASITFLFTDIEGSTPLWDRHPEAMLIAFRQHNAILTEQIERFGGRILESRGDGVRAVFEQGQPVEAVLAIQRQFGRFDWGRIGDLRIRIGLHSVPVSREGVDFFREGSGFQGPVLNYAARIMDAGWGGQIMVSQSVKESFSPPDQASWQSLGRHELKGCEMPITLFSLQHPELPLQNFPAPRTLTTETERSTDERRTTAVSIEPPPFLEVDEEIDEQGPVFVARERELKALSEALDSTRAGHGQMLLIIGGPGRGKSTLAGEFARRVQKLDQDLVVVSGNCNAHTGTGDPYLPFRDALMMLTGNVESLWAGGQISGSLARRLWELMPISVPALVEQAPELIGAFVDASGLYKRASSFASPDLGWFNQLAAIVSAEQRETLGQARIHSHYSSLFKAIARKRPILFVLEDLHWADAASIDLLFHLSREIEESDILLVGTYRPEEITSSHRRDRHPMASLVSELKRQHGDIWLDLGDVAELEGRQFVDAYLETELNRLSEAFNESLYQHTGGHALFTVELLRDMQERGDLERDEDGYWVEAGPINWQSFPAKVEGVIDRRIGRLDEELQSVLTIASVEGESFTAEVVAQVQGLDERRLVQQLSRVLDKQHRLVTAEALERIGRQRLSRYRFRHQLFQHYLYHNLDEMERAYLHEEVGYALEALYADHRELVAVQLARHFQGAGITEKALDYLLLAGERALQLSAPGEAIVHLRNGLASLEKFPEGPDRMQRELDFQIALGNALLATKGYAAIEVGNTYSRAREIAQQLGNRELLMPAMYGLWAYYIVRAENRTAKEIAEEFLILAEDQKDPAAIVAHRAVGGIFLTGAHVEALPHFEWIARHFDAQKHGALAYRYGQDPGAAGLSFGSVAMWLLGYPGRALNWADRALYLARDSSHQLSRAYAHTFVAIMYQNRRDIEATKREAEEAAMVSSDHGFSLFLALANMIQGWLLAQEGRAEDGIELMQRNMADSLASGTRLLRPYFLVLLAELNSQSDHIDEALTALDQGLAEAGETDQRAWEAEIHRLRGDLLWKLDESAADVESHYQRAMEVARRQEAKSLELRTAMSLARLWQSQGKNEAAREMLSEIYEWFTEGFETADLRDAKSLLDSLSET